MVKEPLAQSQSLPKPDRSKLMEYPTLSLKERDRRWGLARKMMEENEVEALMVLPGGQLDGDPSNYFTNYGSPLLFFPLKGDPVTFQIPNEMIFDTLLKSEAYGIDSWVEDTFYLPDGDAWVKILRDRKLTSSRIGILARSHFTRAEQQRVANALMESIKSALPSVTFVDLWNPFVDIWLAKSDEEIAMFRKAALGGEVASEEFVNACKAGNTVADVEKAITSALIPYGIKILYKGIGCGPYGGRGISWLEAGVKPPVISKGDLITTEIFLWVGSLHAQVQLAVSVGEPNKETKKSAALAREAYEIGVETIRPGITVGELSKSMNKPNRREGTWKMTPLFHTINPLTAVDTHPERMLGPKGLPDLKKRFLEVDWQSLEARAGRPRGFELVIKEGHTYQFEPNTCWGQTYVTIGGNILVTKDGCEELNKISTQMVVVPA